MRRVRTSLFNVADGGFFGGSLASVDVHSFMGRHNRTWIPCGPSAALECLSSDYGYVCCG